MGTGQESWSEVLGEEVGNLGKNGGREQERAALLTQRAHHAVVLGVLAIDDCQQRGRVERHQSRFQRCFNNSSYSAPRTSSLSPMPMVRGNGNSCWAR